MSHRQPRIPGTSATRVLYLLSEIPDDLPVDAKNALALRNQCTAEGRCPSCGCEPKLEELAPDVWFARFEHDAGCGALLEEVT
jgi:hypothetical protein